VHNAHKQFQGLAKWSGAGDCQLPSRFPLPSIQHGIEQDRTRVRSWLHVPARPNFVQPSMLHFQYLPDCESDVPSKITSAQGFDDEPMLCWLWL